MASLKLALACVFQTGRGTSSPCAWAHGGDLLTANLSEELGNLLSYRRLT